MEEGEMGKEENKGKIEAGEWEEEDTEEKEEADNDRKKWIQRRTDGKELQGNRGIKNKLEEYRWK
jgi:hypothetical protein